MSCEFMIPSTEGRKQREKIQTWTAKQVSVCAEDLPKFRGLMRSFNTTEPSTPAELQSPWYPDVPTVQNPGAPRKDTIFTCVDKHMLSEGDSKKSFSMEVQLIRLFYTNSTSPAHDPRLFSVCHADLLEPPYWQWYTNSVGGQAGGNTKIKARCLKDCGRKLPSGKIVCFRTITGSSLVYQLKDVPCYKVTSNTDVS